MTEFKRDANDLEQRLRDHYQRRYEQPPDPALIWARVQPQLDRQEHSQPGLLQRAKWLTSIVGRLTIRQQSALKERYKEHTFMDEKIHEEAIHIDRANAHDPRFTKTKPSLRRRIQHLAEAGIAAVLVAGLLLSWFVITRVHSTQGTPPAPLFTYTSQPGEDLFGLHWTSDKHSLTFIKCEPPTPDTRCSYLAWNTVTGKVKQLFTMDLPYNGDGGSFSVMNSPDGRFSLIVMSDITKNIGVAKLVNVFTGQVKQIYQENGSSFVLISAFSRDGKFLAFAGVNGYIHVWDIAAGKTILTFHVSELKQISWSADGGRIIVETSTGLQVWSAQTGQQLAQIAATPTMYMYEPFSSNFSPDGQRVLTYDPQAGTFAVRDTGTLKVLQTLQAQAHLPVDSAIVTWLAGGARVLLGYNQQGSIWNPVTGQRIASFPFTVEPIYVRPPVDEDIPVNSANAGGERYIACLQGGDQWVIRDALTGAIVQTFSHTAYVSGSFRLLGDTYLVVATENHTHGEVYNALTGQPVLSFQGMALSQVALSRDGRYIAVANNPPPTRGESAISMISTVQIFAAR